MARAKPSQSVAELPASDVSRNRSSTVLILCRHFAGYGGEENYVMCLLDALKEHDTVVFVTKSMDRSGFVPKARPNLRVQRYTIRHFLAYLAQHSRDTGLFISFSADPFPKEWLAFKALDACAFPKIIIPAGNDVTRVLKHYDHIAWEAGNADAYGFGGHPKNALLHPPGLHPMNLPIEFPSFAPTAPYYLTVFNNYNKSVKGTDAVYEVARQTTHPIIWCTRQQPLPDGIPGKLFPVSGSRSLLSMLMMNCRAYVCFSATEGFSWSNFEAMMHGRPIVSRPIGVAGDFVDQIYSYQDTEHLVRILNDDCMQSSVNYDLLSFSPAYFMSQLQAITRGSAVR